MKHADSDRPTGSTEPPAAEWDTRYRKSGRAMWSGRPNGRLVVEVSGLTPGRALDVGCGEGADAIWLATRGWIVTAIDVSAVAVSRAHEAARAAGAVVEWINDDVLTTPFPARSFDLVSLQYPALPKVREQGLWQLLDSVCSGGVLLAVYHDLDATHREHMKSKGVDPADYIGVDELSEMLTHDFTVEGHAVWRRIDPPPATQHVHDVVLRARRR